jgi:hypothetical protein
MKPEIPAAENEASIQIKNLINPVIQTRREETCQTDRPRFGKSRVTLL